MSELAEIKERLENLERLVGLQSDEYLTVKEASQMFKVTERWLYEQARSPRFPAIRCGASIRIPKNECIRHFAERW